MLFAINLCGVTEIISWSHKDMYKVVEAGYILSHNMNIILWTMWGHSSFVLLRHVSSDTFTFVVIYLTYDICVNVWDVLSLYKLHTMTRRYRILSIWYLAASPY